MYDSLYTLPLSCLALILFHARVHLIEFKHCMISLSTHIVKASFLLDP